MAKYNVKYGCGHEDTVQLYGTGKERESRIAWLETVDCPKCYESKKFGGFEEVEMPYSEYKNKFADCKTKKDSYDAKTKTIIVYVKPENK